MSLEKHECLGLRVLYEAFLVDREIQKHMKIPIFPDNVRHCLGKFFHVHMKIPIFPDNIKSCLFHRHHVFFHVQIMLYTSLCNFSIVLGKSISYKKS